MARKRNRKGALRRRVMKRLVKANARLAEAAEVLKGLSSLLAPALRKEISKVITSAEDYKAIHNLLSPAKEDPKPVSKKSKEPIAEQPAKKRGRPKQTGEEQPKRKRNRRKKSAE